MKKTSLEIEKKLLPRLRMMGFVLLFFALISLTYAILAEPYLPTVDLEKENTVLIEEESLGPDLEESPTFTATSSDRLNIYFIASAFAVIGAACLVAYMKKKAEFQSLLEAEAPVTEEEHSSG